MTSWSRVFELTGDLGSSYYASKKEDVEVVKRLRLVCRDWHARFDAPSSNRGNPLSVTCGHLCGVPLPRCVASERGVFNVHANTTYDSVLRDLERTRLSDHPGLPDRPRCHHISISVYGTPRSRARDSWVMVPDEAASLLVVNALARHFATEAIIVFRSSGDREVTYVAPFSFSKATRAF
jgi:hypothetical protein